MMYIIGSRNGKDVIVSDKEIIENALQQEKEGIKPDFSPRYMPDVKGWLIWSNYKYGAGIVYRRKSDSKMIIITGVQGDFTIC